MVLNSVKLLFHAEDALFTINNLSMDGILEHCIVKTMIVVLFDKLKVHQMRFENKIKTFLILIYTYIICFQGLSLQNKSILRQIE